VKRLQLWLDMLYEDRLTEDFDLLCPVIGDEGKGKSTLIMQIVWLWLDITDQEQTVENAISKIEWDLEGFEDALGGRDQYDVIVVHDAARVMSRKKAMHADQKEVEEDLLDARFGNYLVLMGYQEFSILPTVLAERRAKQALFIPDRGTVHGHNEDAIRKRYEDGSWPDPALRDTYPDLEGLELWERFEEEDQRRKKERIQSRREEAEDDEEDMSPKELADQIQEDGVEAVVSIHGGHGNPYIDKDLIEVEYEVSGNKAKKAAKVLKKRGAMQPA
jgi:hypothetical protein